MSQIFPTTSGTIDETYNGLNDIFVSKICANGSILEYSTFLGGSESEFNPIISIDSIGCVYIGGITASTNFPTTSGTIDESHNGLNDIFVSKISANGTDLEFSTYFGSSSSDYLGGLTIDNSGSVYLTGQTRTSVPIKFPTTPGAINESCNGDCDGFLTKMHSNGSELEYSTFLGGLKTDLGEAITVDNDGAVYLAGFSGNSTKNFPTTSGTIDEIHNGLNDVILCKIQLSPDVFPDVSFSTNQTNIVAGQSIEFTFEGNKGNLPSILQWNFGDGSDNVTDENPIHQFLNAGDYVVNLTITDLNGDVDTASIQVFVQADLIPNVSISANQTNIVAGQSIEFTFVGNNGNLPSNLQWDFGDGSNYVTDESQIHRFLNAGDYVVTLTITDLNGDVDTASIQVFVQADILPIALISANETDIIEGNDVKFSFTGSSGNIDTRFQWDFGDGSDNVTDENPIHQFTKAGTYTITLTITDLNGDTDNISMIITVQEDDVKNPRDPPKNLGLIIGLTMTFIVIIVGIFISKLKSKS